MTGTQLRDNGIARVVNKNAWLAENCENYARRISARKGSVTTDDIREFVENLGIEPTHRNFYGALMRGVGWKCIERRPSKIKSNHGRYIRVMTFQEV